MSKKLKGFSLAELLIALLIISIVLSAAIPTITKKSRASNENPWRWTNNNNSTYFGVGANQTAIIGAEFMPFHNYTLNNGNTVIDDDYNYTTGKNKANFLNQVFRLFQFDDAENNLPFTTVGDKLVIAKRSLKAENSNMYKNFTNSHISFYNIGDGDTTNSISYAGRLASDSYNLALGIGTLQSMDAVNSNIEGVGVFQGHNTAIGHYSLMFDKIGQFNTALGERAGAVAQASNNTAVGYFAMGNIRAHDGGDPGEQNTVIGAHAMYQSVTGSNNTVVGYYGLGGIRAGRNNTAIGSGACNNIEGNNNICIGMNAGAQGEVQEDETVANINKNYAFYLGNDSDNVPFMYGNMSRQNEEETASTDSQDKSLFLNLDLFQINKSNGQNPVLMVRNDINDVEDSNQFYFIVNGHKQATGSTAEMAVLTFRYDPDSKDIVIDTHDVPSFDSNATNNNSTARNISFSNLLKMELTKREGDAHSAATPIVSFKTMNNRSIININDAAEFSTIRAGNANAESGILRLKRPTQANADFEMKVNVDTSDKNLVTTTLASLTKYGKIIISAGTENGSIILDGATIIETGSNLFLKDLGETNDEQDIVIVIKNIKERLEKLEEKVKELEAKVAGIPSDIRLKNIISDNKAGLKEINALEVKNYTYKNDKKKTPHVGVIAQQLQKVFPDAVSKDKDGYLQIRQEDIFYAMVNSIKELFIKIQDITAKITGLDKRITELEKQNALLKKQNAEFEKRLSKLEKASK